MNGNVVDLRRPVKDKDKYLYKMCDNTQNTGFMGIINKIR